MKKINHFRIKIVLILVLMITLSMVLFTHSWYVIDSERKVESSPTDVMTPYFLYLLNPDDEKSLSVSIGNIHPGEVKRMVIAVSSKNEDEETPFDIAKDNDFRYQLELAYTENLMVDYSVFSLVADENGEIPVYDKFGTVVKMFSKEYEDAMTSEDVSEERRKEMYGEDTEGIVNLGRYELFEKDSNDGELHLVSKVEADGTVTYAMDYYLIEIKWKDGMDFNEYTKETDLVYVIVKALQPRPTEKDNTGN